VMVFGNVLRATKKEGKSKQSLAIAQEHEVKELSRNPEEILIKNGGQRRD